MVKMLLTGQLHLSLANRASNLMRITELILAMILVTSRCENKFISLNHIVNVEVSIKLNLHKIWAPAACIYYNLSVK